MHRLEVPEILAPAGGRAQFFAALNAGADACYLGLKVFNARARAENFSIDDLRELLPLARAARMKVLVTLNILIKDTELETLVATMADLEELEVDAIIVQDLAVLALARQSFPRLTLHASTQMAVHNLDGVNAAADLGFRRVVLARELTTEELRRIRNKVDKSRIELEAFCHGSLCYSYSGLCFFSGAGDARSGNRGECAYTCRQPYTILSEPGHGFLFSMKDLDTDGAVLKALVNSGVHTLKIEGRKKDAQYVATSVRLYRERLNRLFGFSTGRGYGLTDKDALADPEHDQAFSFQRQKTSFYLAGRYHENVIDLDNPTHLGMRVGKVSKVVGSTIELVPEVDLERFDGLRLESGNAVYHAKPQHGEELKSTVASATARYAGQHAEFSLREMVVDGRQVATASRGSLVRLSLPAGLPHPKVGDLVVKTRSADLKRRVEALSTAPADTRLRPWPSVDIACTASRTDHHTLRVSVAAQKLGTVLAEQQLEWPLSKAESPRLAADLGETFAVFGDVAVLVKGFSFEGTEEYFCPRAKLKELKKSLSASLPAALTAWRDRRKTEALTWINTPSSTASPTPPPAAASWRLKCDRLGSLRASGAQALALGLNVKEMIFEPKRAFLTDLRPDHLANELRQASADLGLPIRIAVPAVVRAFDEPLLSRWLKACHAAGIDRYEIANLGAEPLLARYLGATAGLDLATDFSLYALNRVATRFWLSSGASLVTLSIEDDLTNLRQQLHALSSAERERLSMIVYKDTPLFIAEACSLTALHNGCPGAKVCGYRDLTIANAKGETFVVAHESCKSIVYGQQAYAITHRVQDILRLGVSDLRVDFVTRPYSDAEIQTVLLACRAGATLPNTHSANFDGELR